MENPEILPHPTLTRMEQEAEEDYEIVPFVVSQGGIPVYGNTEEVVAALRECLKGKRVMHHFTVELDGRWGDAHQFSEARVFLTMPVPRHEQ